MNRRPWIIGAILGFALGYIVGCLWPLHGRPQAVALESGTYCCDRIDIAQKCEKKTAACPADKPITVLVP